MLPDFIIIADENIDAGIITFLRQNSINVISIYENNRGISDLEIIDLAVKNNAIVLTEDKDFGEWVFAHKKELLSVILLRYHYSEVKKIQKALINLILQYNEKLLSKFSVVTATKIRIRDI